MSDEDLLSLAKSLKPDDRPDRLKGALASGLQFDPDAYAKAVQLSAKTGVVPQAVMRDMKAFEAPQIDHAQFVNMNPRVADWLVAKSDHAAMAHDDLESLRDLEDASRNIPQGLTPSQRDALIQERARVAGHNRKRNEAESLASTAGLGFTGPILAAAETAAAIPSLVAESAQAVGDFLTGPQSFDATARRISEAVKNPLHEGTSGGVVAKGVEYLRHGWGDPIKTGPAQYLTDPETGNSFENPDYRWYGRDTVQTLASVPGAVAFFALTGKAGVQATVANAGREKYQQAISEGANPLTAAAEGAGSAGINYMLMNKMPHQVPTRTIGGQVLQAGARGVTLGLGVSSAENALGRLHGSDRPLWDGATQSIVSMVGFEMVPVVNRLAQAASVSRLKARSPEAFKSAADAILKDTGIENVMIPANAMETFFQATGIKPEHLGQDVVKSYTEALAAGTDVVVPMSSLLASKATPEQINMLLPDVRMGIGGLTHREVEAYNAEAGKADLKSQAEPVDAGPQKAIYEETRAQLLDAGNSERVADTLADRHSRVMVNLARDFGQDPLTMNERFGLRIYRPAPGEGQNPVDISLGRMGGGDKLPARDIFAENPEMDPLYWQGETLSTRLAKLREKLTLEQGVANAGDLQANRESGAAGIAGSEGSPGVGADSPVAADGSAGGRRASADYARRRLLQHTSPEGIDAFYRADQKDVAPVKVEFKSWDGTSHEYEASVMGRDVFVEAPGPIAKDATRSGIRMEVLPDGELYVRLIENGDVKGSGDFLYKEAIKTAMSTFPEVTLDSMVMGETSILGTKARRRVKGSDILEGRDSITAATTVRDFLAHEPDQFASRLRELGIDPMTATDAEVAAKLGENPRDQIFFQPMKRRTEDFKKLRTRMASSRSLSPSHQSGELTRRALEARAKEDEFLAWENGLKAIQAGDILPSDNRGFIQFSPDRKVSIALLEKSDLSTFTHEVGHMYLEVMGDLATAEGAKGAGVESYRTILDFLGVKGRDELTSDHHEKFARAMEAYAMEGKAPTPELKTAFQRVKFWMMQVYRSISELGVKLNPEIRGVFDRMFAGEEAVAKAQEVVDIKPMFATAEDMGVTPAEFNAYSKASAKAIGTARDAVESRLIRELVREKESWWKSEAAKVAEEVTAEVETDPAYQAFKALTDGKLEDGTPIKLNKDALEAQFGKGVGKELPRSKGWAYTREGGMDAEAAAEILGFSSGDHLMETLRNLEPKRERIKRITDERMKAKHGDVLTDGTLADVAVEELHNAAREDMKLAELRVLRAKQRQAKPVADALAKDQRAQDRQDRATAKEALAVPPVQAFREAARELVEQTTVRDLQPYSYLTASRRAARESEAAMLKKDWQAAGDAKQKEILNQHLFLEATKAKEEAAAIAEYGKNGESAKFQAKLGKAQGDYLAQWNALASRYEFRKVTNQELDARAQNLEAWAAAQQAAGEGVIIDPALYREGAVKNWREVPLVELRAVHDALKNIETVARRQRKVLDGDRQVDFEAAVHDLREGAYGNLKAKPLPLDPMARSFMDKAASVAKSINTGIIKMERVVDHLDQGDINGPWRRHIFEPLVLAQFKEYELNQKVTSLLAEAMETMPKDQRHSMLDTYEIPGIGKVTRKFILGMAMNWGNASNREKLLKGMGWANSQEAVGRAFDKLNRADWEFVQKTWDAIDTLWPEIASLQRRMTGIEPPRIDREAFSVTLPDGSTMRMDGGYFPVVYDKTKSSQGAMQADMDIMNSEGGFQGPVTFKGHTKERVKFSAPLNLDFEHVLVGHVSKVIKDISHREAAMSVAKLVRDQGVREAISETMGPEYEAMLMPWLKGTVNDAGGQLGADVGMWKNMLMTTRSNMVLAGLSFRAGSVLVQATDLGRAMTKVAPRHLGQALLDFGRHPIETTQLVRSMSKEMVSRSENLDRDTRAMLRRTQGKDSWMNQVQKVGMEGLAWADTITSVTTWKGAYEQSIAEGKPHEQAVREADRTVRLTMMSSAPKDLVAVQRVGDIGMKFITMFIGDATAAYGTMNEGVRQIAMGKDVGSHLFKMSMVGMLLPVLGQLIKNRGPRDDEDKAWWAVKNALLSLPSSIPIARDIAQSLDSGQDYKFTPVANAIDKSVKAARMAGKVATGDAEWSNAFMLGFDAIGTLGGIPGTSQIMTSAKYLRDVKSGKKPKPKTAMEAVKNTVFGPPPKGR